MKLVAAVALLAVPLLAACPKPRTSAATQPSPAMFDVSKSDPKAIAVVDAGIAALGGYANWEKLKELRFGITYNLDGEVKAVYEHAWDRWNGRAYFAATQMATTHGKPEDVKVLEIKHDLFDKDKKPWVAYDGGELMRSEAASNAKTATKQLTADLWYIAAIYKAKDPGVILAVENAEIRIADDTVEACKKAGCTSIKVTFEKGVGTDTWILYYDNETHLPMVMELVQGGGRIGYLFSDWVESGGLKWPGKLTNIGHKGEIYELDGIKVGEPEDETYEVQVR
jgi:hypothetical protein